MKRFVSMALSVAVMALAVPAAASAQAAVFVGGGVTSPTADFKDFGDGDGAKLGWMASAGAQVGVGGGGLSLGARAFYGSNSHDYSGDKTNLYGGSGLAMFTFGQPAAVAPFVYGEFGYQAHSYKSDDFPDLEDSQWKPFVGGGVGVGFPLGGVRGFGVVGYTQGFGADENEGNTTYFGGTAGLSFPVGG